MKWIHLDCFVALRAPRNDETRLGIKLEVTQKIKMTTQDFALQHPHYEKIRQFEINDSNASFVTEFIDQLLKSAILAGASDLHLEPFRLGMIIRARIDGLLHVLCEPSKAVINAIISHLKIRADLDIAEKRLPQDGRFRMKNSENIDYICRLSTFPTLYGEKIVIRFLPINSHHPNISELGLDENQQTLFINYLKKPQGLILITGPTGSGKTTTLYSALAWLNSPEKNIISLENPVEIELQGINQLNIDNKIGLTFHTALTAVLRQDPDIILVGEIRDYNTAELALQAAQTGHLVLSTLHTKSTLETLTRLSLMGISELNLLDTLELIVAQRLVRKCCQKCKSQTQHDCNFCKAGYKGRTGVFELLPITAEIRQLLLTRQSQANIAKRVNLETLWQVGIRKVELGITTLTELERVIGSAHS